MQDRQSQKRYFEGMAKRVKLNAHASNSNGPMSLSIEKVLHLQKLLEQPEADRIRKLDTEMANILNERGLSVSEKVKRFEEALDQFRYARKKLMEANQNGEFIDGNMKDMVRGMIGQVLKDIVASEQGSTGSERSHSVHNGSDVVPMASTPVQEASPEQEQEEWASPAYEAQATPEAATINDTPVAFKERKSKKKRKSFVETLSQSAAQKQINSLLRKAGLQMMDKKVVISPTSEIQAKRKKKKLTFAQATYDKALNYVTSNSTRKIPYQTDALVGYMYEKIKDGDNFEAMLRQFPNLRDFHKSKVSFVNEWNSLE